MGYFSKHQNYKCQWTGNILSHKANLYTVLSLKFENLDTPVYSLLNSNSSSKVATSVNYFDKISNCQEAYMELLHPFAHLYT